MANVNFKRNGYLPLRKLKIILNDNTFTLKGNETREINLPAGEYSFTLKMDWWKSTNQITVGSDGNTVEINHYLPDIFYGVGIIGILALALLAFFSILSTLYLGVGLLLFFLPQLYLFFTKNKKYFTIKLEL